MRIRKFFEGVQSPIEDIKDSFEELEDKYRLKIIEYNPISFCIHVEEISKTTSKSDDWINLMKEIKESILKSKCDRHSISSEEDKILIKIGYEDTVDYSKSLFIDNDELMVDSEKVTRFLEIMGGLHYIEIDKPSRTSCLIEADTPSSGMASQKRTESLSRLFSDKRINMSVDILNSQRRLGYSNKISAYFWIEKMNL